MTTAVTVNHVGLCVTDLQRSQRFYEHALGFSYDRTLRPPDAPTAKLLRLDAPVGLTAIYLTLGGFVLELLHFEHAAIEPSPRRFTDPGLTHLSFTVEDIDTARERVVEAGGTVLTDTDLGVAVLITDPDGQLLELLAART